MDAQVKGTSIAGSNSEKAKALQAALAQIEKQFGKGTIMRLGEGEKIEDIQVVSTGSLGLDIALGRAAGRRDAEAGRHLRLRRCRACAGRAVRTEARREPA